MAVNDLLRSSIHITAKTFEFVITIDSYYFVVYSSRIYLRVERESNLLVNIDEKI